MVLTKIPMENLSEALLNRIHANLSFICTTYIRGPPPESPKIPLPQHLADIYVKCSKLLGRNPMLDYADCILNNWEFTEEAAGKLVPQSLEDITIINMFTGTPRGANQANFSS